MVRWLKLHTFKILMLLNIVIVSSCVETRKSRINQSLSENSKESVEAGYGRVLADNPIILSANESLSQSTDLTSLLGDPVFITNKTTLKRDCTGLSECLIVTKDQNIAAFENSDRKWAYPVLSTEFLQINVFYHVGKIMDKFFTNLNSILTNGFVIPYLNPTDPSSPYPTSLPQDIFAKNVNAYKSLYVYADCDFEDNAYFSSATNSLCFGYDSSYPTKVKFAQDSTVVYHEYGHSLVDTMINMRNAAYKFSNPTFTKRSNLGYSTYDEAAAMNEGIADFFSYYINGRTHFGEWALGRFNDNSRPMSEDDSLHLSGIAADESSRLSYPNFITYNANLPNSKVESVHDAGQIFSHYLVSLASDLQNKCSMSKSESQNAVTYVLNESLSELGDLTSLGSDHTTAGQYTVNMNPTYSEDWLRSVNPINFRKMAQYMAKYLKYIYVANSFGACASGSYTTDDIESLLDQYGLLLFRSYNENGNGSPQAWAPGITQINPLNRKRSELISKSLLQIESRIDFSPYSVVDNRSTIESALSGMSASGQIRLENLSPLIPENYGFNNGNAKISPGEVVALFVNPYNNSNSTMGGVTITANDWAHMQNDKPCKLKDGFPTLAQGGQDCSASPNTGLNFSATDRYHPACLIEYNNGTSTSLLSQKEYFTKMNTESGLLAKDCLDSANTKTCMVRAIKGADFSNLSKLGPKSNWLETIKDVNGDTKFKTGNFIFFEINKNIPFGTKVVCRLRATFTNCDDCHHNASATFAGDDYNDWQYAGEDPFKVLNISFTIAD